jgi:transcriptional regulator GlxA family with amidase domain
VIVVAFPDVQALDVVGPLEVFAMANRYGAHPAYATALVSASGQPVTTSSGLSLGTERASRREAIDTLLVAGGTGTAAAMADERLIAWLRAAAASARRVTSVCSGDTLARLFPAVEVDADPIYVRDGNVWTSAGVTAGMDLALALVEHDNGGEVALAVARQLVLFTHRPGGQSQFSAQLAVRRAEHQPLRDALAFVAEHPEADLSVPALARRAAMSVRTFARAFSREVGTTPAVFVQRSRVEAARRLLETTDGTVDDIARACGFGTVETMHRAFQRVVRTSPGQYRRLFAVPA